MQTPSCRCFFGILLRGGSAACVASSCHGRYWSALWLGAMAAHLWILLVDWCWLMLIDLSICLVGLTFTIDLTLLCMWACRSRHHYNESSTGLVCTWTHYKAVPCFYCFGLRDVISRWQKISKWTGKILPLLKCNVMAFVLIMVYVVMALAGFGHDIGQQEATFLGEFLNEHAEDWALFVTLCQW